jgi:hypothetical protein
MAWPSQLGSIEALQASELVMFALFVRTSIVTALLLPATVARAQEPAETPGEADNGADLATKLSNPISSLISIPFQFNFDFNRGPYNTAGRYELKIQPVIPFAVTRDYNVISRTILPIVREDNTGGIADENGLADTVQSFFVSPRAAGPFGLVWGFGPALLLPTATNNDLGAGTLGIGPTAVVLRQQSGWTVGALANHLWSVVGDDGRPSVSSTFLQPFVAYQIQKTTISANSESTYDWERSQWTVPINATISQLTKVAGAPVQFTAGPRFYVEGRMGGADWGVRFAFTALLPK